jgi:recombination protein RecR
MAINKIESLIYLLAKLPGLGPRSARRVLLHMLKHKETFMIPLGQAIISTAENVSNCKICGNIDICNPCNICDNPMRDASLICVVESVADLWAIERGDIFSGYYHVLGGTLSINNDHGPDSLNFDSLMQKATDDNVKEVIIATNATVEGQTTAYYITELLKNCEVKISKLAHGIPMGGELDYLDEATLLAALKARQPF